MVFVVWQARPFGVEGRSGTIEDTLDMCVKGSHIYILE